MKWPIYFSDNIHISNPNSETGILCLWTKKERLIEKINPELYSFIGQLYSKDYGIMILIRNLLAKNDLRNLVLTGIDLNDSGRVIKALFNNGIDKNGKIKNTETYLDRDIKKEHIKILKDRINLIDLTNNETEQINKELKFKKKGPKGPNIILPLPELEPPRRLPTDFTGFKARGIDFITAYKTLINFILKYGVYNEKEKKLKAWNITIIAKKVTTQDKQFLGTKKTNKIKLDVSVRNKYFESIFCKEIDAWNIVQEIAKTHKKTTALHITSFEAYIKEKDLEAAYELVGSIPDTQKWDQDPHGTIIIRIENNLIRVTHLDPKGKVINEFFADNAKTLYKKIIDDNKISLLNHALYIGGELKKAEIALKRGEKYEQDKT
jgi:hypothetical protein